MSMKHIAAAILLGGGLLASSANAQGSIAPDRFTHEPTGFRVTVKSSGGAMWLTGRHPVTGERFKVHVSRTGHVTGTWKGAPVDFMMKQVEDTRLATR